MPPCASVSASVNRGGLGSCLPREAVRVDGLGGAFGAAPVSLGAPSRDTPTPHPPVPSPGVGPWPGFSTGPAPHKGTLGFLCPPPQRPQGMGWLYPRTLGTPSCREAVRLTQGSTPRAPRSSRSPERGSTGARFRPSRRRLRASGDPLNDWPPGGHSYWLSRRN